MFYFNNYNSKGKGNSKSSETNIQNTNIRNKKMKCCKSVVWEKTEKVHVGVMITKRDLRLYFTNESEKKKNSHTGSPDLVKATGNVTAADASNVNTEPGSFSRKKERQGSSHSTNSCERGSRKKCMQLWNTSCH